MNSFLQETELSRRKTFQQVSEAMDLQTFSVEKDLWVCWTLRELHALPGVGAHLTFKGGTSLSKAWKLIERFSEDVDLVVDKKELGFDGENSPEKGISGKKRRARLDDLQAAGRRWVQERVMPSLATSIRGILGGMGWSLEVDPGMPDGQCLLFRYPSVIAHGSIGYLNPVVKLEFGARSDDWPHEEKPIVSYVQEHFPNLDFDTACTVRALSPERTFWEKACLLHEENFRPAGKKRGDRLSRHYYDLGSLLYAGVGAKALADMPLFNRVVEHRKFYFQQTWVDYSTHMPGSFRILPLAGNETGWREDYDRMRESMFFGEPPSFDALMADIAAFEREFNAQV